MCHKILRCVVPVISAVLTLIATAAHANIKPTIEPIADPSVRVGERLSIRVVPVDPEGQVPSLLAVNLPGNATFDDNRDGTRTFHWVPTEQHVGQWLVDFNAIDASDPSLIDIKTVRITILPSEDGADAITEAVASASQSASVNSANSPPVITPIDNQRVSAGNAVNFRVIPTDANGSVPGLALENPPAGAEFVDNFDGTRTFNWVPDASQSGSYSLRFVAIDADDTTVRVRQSVEVVVTNSPSAPSQIPVTNTPAVSDTTANGNQPPRLAPFADQVVYLGQTLRLPVAPSDPDGDVPGLTLDRLPDRAKFEDNRDGTRTLIWQPYPINLGDNWITFTAIDAKDASIRTNSSVRIIVAVNPDPAQQVNFPPVINGINNPVIRVGDTLNQIVQPLDPDFDVPGLSVLNPPTGAQFVDNRDGTRSLRWTATPADIGDTSVTFRAVDTRDSTLTFERTITITVIDPASVSRQGSRLRDLAEQRGLLLGYASMLRVPTLADNQLYEDIARQEFNIVTPENSMKWGWIQPLRGQFDFEDADYLADFARDNGMVYHGHPLIWYTQLPGWLLALPPESLESEMLRHIDAVVGHFAGRVQIWDVVNEALEDDGRLRDSIWHEAMGTAYIDKAFQRARQNDPNATLIYNDYDVAWKNPKSDAMYRLLADALNRGVPIDGVGFQMHLRADFDQYQSVIDNLQRFANLGLDIMITEFDVAMDDASQQDKQAEVYRRILQICIEQPACNTVQAWGFTDRYSWRHGQRPLLFDESYQAKPAYYAWQEVLR